MTTLTDIMAVELLGASDLKTPEVLAMKMASDKCLELGLETMHGLFVAREWPQFMDAAQAQLHVCEDGNG